MDSDIPGAPPSSVPSSRPFSNFSLPAAVSWSAAPPPPTSPSPPPRTSSSDPPRPSRRHLESHFRGRYSMSHFATPPPPSPPPLTFPARQPLWLQSRPHPLHRHRRFPPASPQSVITFRPYYKIYKLIQFWKIFFIFQQNSTECGTRLFLEVLFIFLRSSSCNLYVALAALQLYYPTSRWNSQKTFSETLETT